MGTEIEDLEQLVAQAEEHFVAKLNSVGVSTRTAWHLVNVEHTEWMRRTGDGFNDAGDLKSHQAICRAWTNYVYEQADKIKHIPRSTKTIR
uniref:hypothetical protein n=1 Tax=Roseivirga sp. TaxID=1964215 RepID=UPI0040478386